MLLPGIPTRQTASIELPVQFARLRDIAYNLWWAWSQPTRALFHRIDPIRWMHYRNPIELLIDLEPERWYELQRDTEFIRAYRNVVAGFDEYMVPSEPTWFDRRHPGNERGPVAYFSTEFGWHECLQIYSGGLGILSGDHSKAASDLGLPFIGVGLMYKHGYFRQTIDADGQQQHFYPDYDLHRIPLLPVVGNDGHELELSLPILGREVRFRIWKADVGRVPVLLLDTDLSSNDPADRPITSILYVRGREMRLCQELVLGFGGALALRELGVAPSIWHMNEGHSALLSLERLRERVETRGETLDEALVRVADSAVFTTHTPVPAGNETFERHLAYKYLSPWADAAGIDVSRLLELGHAGPGDDQPFNMTALALRTAARANGVSVKHGEVATGMWGHLIRPDGESVGTIESITNGVHLMTWLGRNVRHVYEQHLGPGFEHRVLDIDFDSEVQKIDDAEIWEAHRRQKTRLVAMLRKRVMEQLARHGQSPDELRLLDHLLDPDILLVGFARRFATYKRADLLLRDFERLTRIVGPDDRPIQFVFAGKAHPADRPGQELIRRIWEASHNPVLKGRLLYMENYDMRVGRNLVQGVDVWLNNPRRPQEASGTSGMKAALNGALNCSVLDGWWCEGFDASHGWAIGGDPLDGDHEQEDARDADSLYRILADEIVPCFYDRDENGLPRAWIARMKRAMGALSPRFSTQRMVREYATRFYFPSGSGERSGDA